MNNFKMKKDADNRIFFQLIIYKHIHTRKQNIVFIQ